MATGRDYDSPVFYREIQKNAYLKRIPNDSSSSKLRPLGQKKPSLKPMWTLFCVHNGRTPFLEQYPDADSPATKTHTPVWRACLRNTRHVTASVKPHVGEQYDFLVDTDHGPVRMLAPDWESMQDWVTTLRNKLGELKVLGRGENVYGAPPAAPTPRAGTRDPTSPLPPTPPHPPDRVPGIELVTTVSRPPNLEPITEPEPELTPDNPPTPAESPAAENVDISNWETEEDPQPSTSQETEPKSVAVAKICGQNICLDGSLLKRYVSNSDDESVKEINKLEMVEDSEGFKQKVLVKNEVESVTEEEETVPQSTNITVIQVSNKNIPKATSDTDSNSNFAQKVKVEDPSPSQSKDFVNIVNTETSIENFTQNEYGTVFTKETDSQNSKSNIEVNDGVYERLCAFTSLQTTSPHPVRKLAQEKSRKSSLPNLEDSQTSSPTTISIYEHVFPVNNANNSSVTVNTSRNLLNGRNNDSSIPISTNSQFYVRNIPNGRNDREVTSLPHIGNLPNGRNEGVPSGSVNVSSSANLNSDSRVIRPNVERSNSHNACDEGNRRNGVRDLLIGPKRETTDIQPKPIWKRGLTELSLLSKLRIRRQDSPTRRNEENDVENRPVTSSVKVVPRSRPEARLDSNRRRSNSLSNGSPPRHMPVAIRGLIPVALSTQAFLRAEQSRPGALAARLVHPETVRLAAFKEAVWIAHCARGTARCCPQRGDRVVAINGIVITKISQARTLLKYSLQVDILFHRLPLAKIFVIHKKDQEPIGLRLDSECNIVGSSGPAARAGVPPRGSWALTDVNRTPLDLVKGGEEEMKRLSLIGTETLIIIQPSPFVSKLRAAVKGNKSLLLSR